MEEKKLVIEISDPKIIKRWNTIIKYFDIEDYSNDEKLKRILACEDDHLYDTSLFGRHYDKKDRICRCYYCLYNRKDKQWHTFIFGAKETMLEVM